MIIIINYGYTAYNYLVKGGFGTMFHGISFFQDKQQYHSEATGKTINLIILIAFYIHIYFSFTVLAKGS